MIGGATMNENDWRECSNPERLLVYWYEKGHDIGESERKMRLLAVACCRRIWHLLPAPQRLAVEAAERVAEGDTLTDEEEIRLADSVEDGEGFSVYGPVASAATHAIYASFIDFRIHRVFGGAASAVAWSEVLAQRPDLLGDEGSLRELMRTGPEALGPPLAEAFTFLRGRELKEQCRLVEELYGDLFHGVALDTAWLTSPVVALARAIYEERRFADLPILADALQEAGVTEPNILGHCRSAGPHFLGCWVVDLLLGKA
jgi:hypothetical protein